MGRKSSGQNFKMGSFYRTDDRSGFTVRAEKTRKQWDNAIVDKKLWEPRQPQDFVRGVADRQAVPDPRSEPPPIYTGPIMTTLASAAAVGATSLSVESTFGFSNADNIGVMLDSGSYFNTVVVGLVSGTTLTIASPLPYTAASGNVVTDYEAPGP